MVFDRRSKGKTEMSFVDHLEELRWHIVPQRCRLLILAVIIFFYHDWVFDNIIAGPIKSQFR